MNIAIDVQPHLSPNSKNRGIGNYAADQLRLLLLTDRENNYVLFNLYSEESILELLGLTEKEMPHVKEFYLYTGEKEYLIQKEPNGLKQRYLNVMEKIVRRFLREEAIDIFYFTSPFDYWNIFRAEWFEGVKTIATVYDIIPYLFQKRYLGNNKALQKWYMDIIEFLKKMDRLLVISQSVKDDLMEHIKIDGDKIDVIYSGIDRRYRKLDFIGDAEDIRSRYGIFGKFIMCTGGADPRKNLNELIEAYSMLPDSTKKEYMLAIVCSLHPAGEEELRETASRFGVSDRIILTNFVPFDHLLKLYNMASLMAFPSQYEGFGLPVIEAMACGTPVLCSNNSSLSEIAQGAGILVDPFDTKDIARGLLEALEKTDLKKFQPEMKKRVDCFTWENTVALTMKSIQKIGKEEKPSAISGKKKKIAMFTPLPPMESGIADYSFDIINALKNIYDIDVFVEGGYEGNPFDNGTVRVIPYEKYKKDSYDKTIFQVGNSTFHTYMFDIIKKVGGIVVLHDCNLHGILYHMTAEKGDFRSYQSLLAEEDAEFAKNYVSMLKDGRCAPKIFEFYTNSFVTDYADKIIVHSSFAKEQLLRRDISRDVTVIPLYTVLSEKGDRIALREKYGIAKDAFAVASFGFVAETKRPMKALEAFGRIAEENEKAVYLFVGKAEDAVEKEIRKFEKEKGLEGRIMITGFTPLDAFEEYIELSDACIALRYPYNGESSASVTRILGHKKPLIVSDIGSFGELPDGVCKKAPLSLTTDDSREVEAITVFLRSIMENSTFASEMEERTADYVKNTLSIELIARQYAAVIEKEKNSGVITEAFLKELYHNEIKPLGQKASLEAEKISAALAYSKG